jgi:regulator of sigma E protease
MHKPAGGDLEAQFGRAIEEAPWLAAHVEPVKIALDEGRLHDARAGLGDLRAAVERSELSDPARKSAERGLTDTDDALAEDAYWRAPIWKRITVIAAGPLTNLVFAIVLLAIVFMLGVPSQVDRTIATVDAGTPAAEIVRPGDRILAVNGEQVTGEEISEQIRASQGDPVTLTIERGGRELTVQARPRLIEGAYRLGFTLGLIYESYSPWEAVKLAGERTWEATSAIGASLGRIVTGEGRKDVASPVGIVQASSETLEAGFREYLGILALISLSLALLNLLPLLPLDGGHIAFSIAEGIRGRAIPREAYERASAIGILVVLFLFFIGLTNDVNRIRGG